MGFEELNGNPRIRHILKSYIANDIIPYSIIFSGPRSANMLSFAIAFAKGINCLEMKDDFCGHCTHCREITHNTFLDLQVLEPDGQFYKKEQITYLVEDNYKKPLKGKRKVNILTDVQQMNINSANAFLKVLEEPASQNVFMLLTSNLNALLPTIKSRCQILKFSPLSREEIKSYLVNQKGYDIEKATLISYLGHESMEGLFDIDFQVFMEKRKKVYQCLESLVNDRGSEIILLELYDLSRSREKFLEYLTELANMLSLMIRDIMVLHIEPASDSIINIDLKAGLMEMGQQVSVEKALYLIRRMELLLRDIKRNLNTKVLIQEFIDSYSSKEVTDV